jgi:hypothetical protein
MSAAQSRGTRRSAKRSRSARCSVKTLVNHSSSPAAQPPLPHRSPKGSPQQIHVRHRCERYLAARPNLSRGLAPPPRSARRRSRASPR